MFQQVSYLAVDSLFPEWNNWTQFLDETTSGLRLDALAESHPIEVFFFIGPVPVDENDRFPFTIILCKNILLVLQQLLHDICAGDKIHLMLHSRLIRSPYDDIQRESLLPI